MHQAVDGKREAGRAKKQGSPERSRVAPRYGLSSSRAALYLRQPLSLAQHPVPPLSPADLPCPLMVLRLAQSATYHRFPLRSIPGRAQPLCERYLARRTARGNL